MIEKSEKGRDGLMMVYAVVDLGVDRKMLLCQQARPPK